MSIKSIALQLLFTLVLGGVLYVILKPASSQESFFIDNTVVLAHYVKAKGYDKVLESKQAQMKADIDSASTYLASIQGSKVAIDTVRAAKEMARVKQLQQQYQNHLQAEDQRISAQVREELNQLIEQFAKKSKMKFLLGATGDGNILYAQEEMDKTQDLIQYIDESL